MQAVRVTEEVRKGRNQLAATVVLGHAIKRACCITHAAPVYWKNISLV